MPRRCRAWPLDSGTNRRTGAVLLRSSEAGAACSGPRHTQTAMHPAPAGACLSLLRRANCRSDGCRWLVGRPGRETGWGTSGELRLRIIWVIPDALDKRLLMDVQEWYAVMHVYTEACRSSAAWQAGQRLWQAVVVATINRRWWLEATIGEGGRPTGRVRLARVIVRLHSTQRFGMGVGHVPRCSGRHRRWSALVEVE